MMPVIEKDKKDIWDELMNMRMLKNDTLRPEEKTIQMLMQEYDITENQARRKIHSLELKHLITKRRVTIDGKSFTAYTLTEGLP